VAHNTQRSNWIHRITKKSIN